MFSVISTTGSAEHVTKRKRNVTVDGSRGSASLSRVSPDGWVAAPHFHVAGRLGVDVGVELFHWQLRVRLGLLGSLLHHLADFVVDCLPQSYLFIYLLKAYIAPSTAQGHLRAFHKFKSHTS